MLAQTIRFAKFERIFNKLCTVRCWNCCLYKPLKLLLLQLFKFCRNHISYTSLIIVISHWTSYVALVSICDQTYRVNLRYWWWLNLFVVIWKLTTSQTTILFPLYCDGNNLNQRNAEMKTTSCIVLQQRENTNFTKWHADLLLRASMLAACRCTSTLWWLLQVLYS